MTWRDAIVPVLDRCFHAGGILSYHAIVDGDEVPSRAMHISVRTLRRHLAYVRARYDVIPLRELIDRRAHGRSIDRCVAITFDDAYVGVERFAAPMLRELDLPATVFVAVDAAARGSSYWWDVLEHARRSGGASWSALLHAVGMPPLPPNEASVAAIRDRIISRFAGRLQLAMPDELPDLLHSLDASGLRRLAADARFDFGCHTVTHPALSRLSENEQEQEMARAQAWLEREVLRVVPIVAYPFGLYDARTIRAAHAAGMTAGVTMQPRAPDRRDGAFALPRVGVSEDWSVSAIALRLNAGLGPLFIARAGGRHPPRADPRPAAV